MPRVLVSSYSLTARFKREKDDEVLDRIDGSVDLHAILVEVLRSLGRESKGYHAEKTEKMLESARRNSYSGRYISGLIKYGPYGHPGELLNVDTFRRRPVQSRDALLHPLYFLVGIPRDRKEGILIIQRLGQHSMVGPFMEFLRDRIQQLIPDLLVSLNAVNSRRVWERFADSRATRFELLRRSGPSHEPAHKSPRIGETRVQFQAERRGSLLPKTLIRKLLNGGEPGRKVVEEFARSVGNFEFEEATFTLDHNGAQKTFVFGRNDGVNPSLDITDEIDMVDDEPKFTSIDSYCLEYADEISAKRNLGLEHES